MLVIPIASHLHTLLSELSQTRRTVFFAGLPGVGKKLLIQQLALIANETGRKVHLMNWNYSRKPFETPDILAKYPEVDGVTDPVLRKAVGMWSRNAVQSWHATYSEPEHLLIGEIPLIGNRFLELTQVQTDSIEPLLQSEESAFIVPVPSWEVREAIEKIRDETRSNPQHENDKLDAPPQVLRDLWQELNAVARQMGLTKAGDTAPYNPYIYAGVYEALLEARQSQLLLIDQLFRPKVSVHDLKIAHSRLQATEREVSDIFTTLDATLTPEQIKVELDNWHHPLTSQPKIEDPGARLLLPLPETLHNSPESTQLTENQLTALEVVLALPVDAPPAALLPKIDEALTKLTAEANITLANNRKFDVYDSYFNVQRTGENSGVVFLAGLLFAYRNVLDNLAISHDLTVIELSLLRMALESTCNLFRVPAKV